MRLIDADALKKKWERDHERYFVADHFIFTIEEAPTVDAVPVKHGQWNGYNTDKEGWKRTDGSPVFLTCSECGGVVLNNGSAHWNYCPNCGAKMDGKDEEHGID